MTTTVHELTAASWTPVEQVDALVFAKSPLTVMLEIVSDWLLALVRVNDLGVLVAPTFLLPKSKLDGLSAALVPVALMVTLFGLLVASAVTTRVAPRSPAAFGVKTIPTRQVAEGATV